MFGLFRLVFLVYIAGALLLLAVGYDYMDKNHPKVNLPYKEQVFGLQKIIIDKIDVFIDNNKKADNKKNKVEDSIL